MAKNSRGYTLVYLRKSENKLYSFITRTLYYARYCAMKSIFYIKNKEFDASKNSIMIRLFGRILSLGFFINYKLKLYKYNKGESNDIL